MLKLIVSLLLLTLFVCPHALAQNGNQSRRDSSLQQLLGMNKNEYKIYRDGLRPYDQKLAEALNGQGLTPEAQRSVIAKALSERKSYVENHLTDAQRKKLHDFNRQRSTKSPREKQAEEFNKRLATRGIRVVKDSIP